MQLSECETGKIYMVTDIHLPLNTERRLQALGLTYHTKVMLMNKKRHGALIMKIRGTRFAVGSHIAQQIQVKEADHD